MGTGERLSRWWWWLVVVSGCSAANGAFDEEGATSGQTSSAELTAMVTSAEGTRGLDSGRASQEGGGTDEGSTSDADGPGSTSTQTDGGSSEDGVGASTGEASRALLVTQLGDLSFPLDVTLHGVLEDMAFEVVLVEDSVVTAEDALMVDLVVVSETVSIGEVGGTFRDVERPVVCLEGGIWGAMGMSGPPYWSPGTQLEIVDPTHPIAAGLSGQVAVLVENPGSGLIWVSAPASAQVVARMPGIEGALTAFAYEQGTPMQGGFVAPARRVAFGADVDADGALPSPSDLNLQGVAIFEAAVQWAML